MRKRPLAEGATSAARRCVLLRCFALSAAINERAKSRRWSSRRSTSAPPTVHN
jgi:hypothetical protein